MSELMVKQDSKPNGCFESHTDLGRSDINCLSSETSEHLSFSVPNKTQKGVFRRYFRVPNIVQRSAKSGASLHEHGISNRFSRAGTDNLEEETGVKKRQVTQKSRT